MEMIRNENDGKELYPIDSMMLDNRKIVLGGMIDAQYANSITKAIMALTTQDRKSPIDVILCSPVMSWDVALILCDVFQSAGAPVRMYCVGMTNNAAAVVFVGGGHGRYMTRHAKLQICMPERIRDKHLGFEMAFDGDRDKELPYKIASELIADYVQADARGVKISDDLDECFDAKYCLEHGLCDEIVPFSRIMSYMPAAAESEKVNDAVGYQKEEEEFDTDFWNA